MSERHDTPEGLPAYAGPDLVVPELAGRLALEDAPRPGLVGPCWLVVRGRTSRNGYGRLRCGGREVQAHREAYRRVAGPVPPGLVLDHLCRRRPCCSPWHLEPVTPAENTRRGEAVLFRRRDET